MALEEALADITERLRQGAFDTEQKVSQGIVLRLLQDEDLDWNTWNTALVWPEYQTGEGRADFALCHPPHKAVVLIEVKQPGKAEDAVRQALGYAFHTGVPFIVLTDGRTWGFYLPAEQGSYEERRVYKLDLYERTPEEAAETLRHYLNRARVESGEALKTAREEYRNRGRKDRARAAIPGAWRELIEKGDEDLVELLASAVEAKDGVRPDNDDAAEFLAALGEPVLVEHPGQPPEGPGDPRPRRGKLVLRGREHSYANAKQAMVIVLRELAKGDPSFLQRCSQHPKAQGSKRHYIARTPEELYPDREDLREYQEALPGGWLVATNLNNRLKRTIIKLACEVAGLTFGKDVIVEF